eukprot:COSAG06_NODE_1749_length_8472_cov_6.578866_2_plen_140_part_00
MLRQRVRAGGPLLELAAIPGLGEAEVVPDVVFSQLSVLIRIGRDQLAATRNRHSYQDLFSLRQIDHSHADEDTYLKVHIQAICAGAEAGKRVVGAAPRMHAAEPRADARLLLEPVAASFEVGAGLSRRAASGRQQNAGR